jgi:hypothetical protein
LYKGFFSLLYDVLVLNTLFLKYVTLRAEASDVVTVSGEREGGNPRHVVRKFLLLRLVTLIPAPGFGCGSC